MANLQKLPLASLAEVRASSEAEGHPILLAFDEGEGPGATYWKAGDPGEQTITVTFREPCTLVQITMEVEEREIARTQEVQLALSTDGGLTYFELVRQEFNFSPDGDDVGERNLEHLARPRHQRASSHQAGQRPGRLLCEAHLFGVVASGVTAPLLPFIRKILVTRTSFSLP
jgi:hypothetical protein